MKIRNLYFYCISVYLSILFDKINGKKLINMEEIVKTK